MTREQIVRWGKSKQWQFRVEPEPELRYALDVDIGLMVCVTQIPYAECASPSDPVCGLARFSAHGCGGAPSRAEYVAAGSPR